MCIIFLKSKKNKPLPPERIRRSLRVVWVFVFVENICRFSHHFPNNRPKIIFFYNKRGYFVSSLVYWHITRGNQEKTFSSVRLFCLPLEEADHRVAREVADEQLPDLVVEVHEQTHCGHHGPARERDGRPAEEPVQPLTETILLNIFTHFSCFSIDFLIFISF